MTKFAPQSTRKTLTVDGTTYRYYSIAAAGDVSKLPYARRVLLENLLRHFDNHTVGADDIAAALQPGIAAEREIAYRPARVLMQDFTGVPAAVDLAAMRDAVAAAGGDTAMINPLVPVDLVIDHSVAVDYFGAANSKDKNVALEYERNSERYAFLKWAQKAFRNFRVVPPGAGICHQVNLEHLAPVVMSSTAADGVLEAYPDTVVGTDSHTTMINGVGVLGWGVGGIEAEAAMLGQPVSMLIPQTVGVKLTGTAREGVTATDIVLTITQILRKAGVVGKFVEFFGEGVAALPLENRATIANMAPEYGATCGFFAIDDETLRYLRATGRSEHNIALVEAYAKAQHLWFDPNHQAEFDSVIEFNLSSVVPCLAGPKRPQDRIELPQVAANFNAALEHNTPAVAVAGTDYSLNNGDVVLAAITSCTNTSNPFVLMAAGLLAQKAHAKGLTVKPWVKTSLAPGSQTVTDYLNAAGVTPALEALGFYTVGYGCTTCIGNSGPLPEHIANAVVSGDLNVAGVLSGNRNFEGRINPHIKSNYLASPPLVVAYALAGSVRINLDTDSLGTDTQGNPVYLRDIWPSNAEVAQAVRAAVTRESFVARYSKVFEGDAAWQSIAVAGGSTYAWDNKSTYVQNPPYFAGLAAQPAPIAAIENARIIGLFGDSVTTDHISPAGNIKADSPAGKYLASNGVAAADFNAYGARRGSHDVMMRGTFANIRLTNENAGGKIGGYALHAPSNSVNTFFDTATQYMASHTATVVVAGKEYGTGSSRDWAAKGTNLLGIRAVITESFERIHRSNLVGMGVLPFTFTNGDTRQTLGLTGHEVITLPNPNTLTPRCTVEASIAYPDGRVVKVSLLCRIDTAVELDYFKNGGVLPYVLRSLLRKKAAAA